MKCSKCNTVKLIGKFKNLGMCSSCSNVRETVMNKEKLNIDNQSISEFNFEEVSDFLYESLPYLPEIEDDLFNQIDANGFDVEEAEYYAAGIADNGDGSVDVIWDSDETGETLYSRIEADVLSEVLEDFRSL